MRLLSGNDARSLDFYIIENLAVPADVLAERAGIALSKACLSLPQVIRKGCGTIDVFAGKGMNGVDALVCAREVFSCGHKVRVWIMPEMNDPANERWQLTVCRKLGIPVSDVTQYPGEAGNGISGVIIDGIFCTSFDSGREAGHVFCSVVDKISVARESGAYVISADIPSGLDPDTGLSGASAVTADETVTFIAPKIGLFNYPGRNHAGRITVEKLGFSDELLDSLIWSEVTGNQNIYAITMRSASVLLPERVADGHKGVFGRVAFIGGSKNMAGAVCLCAQACYRSGAGLVYLIVPEEIRDSCLKIVPEAVTAVSIEELQVKPDVVIAGPGGSDTEGFTGMVFRSIDTADKLVLDAQALHVIADHPVEAERKLNERFNAGMSLPVITPHPGEMKKIMPEDKGENRIKSACKAAEKYKCVCVLKGAGTVVAEPGGNVWINTTGNSSMSKGGSGDILAGVIGAFMAQGMGSSDSAVLGVFLHGLCGDIAAKEMSVYSANPVDIIRKLSEGFKEIIRGRYQDG